MKKLLFIAGVFVTTLTGIKAVLAGELKNIKITDFGFSLPFMSFGVLDRLGTFEENLNHPIIISPASGTLFRPGDEGDHGSGNAIDIMLPQGPDLKTAFDCAVASGFNAVGIYPHWKPYPGMHLGIRLPLDRIYKWAGIKIEGQQVYVSLDEGLTYA